MPTKHIKKLPTLLYKQRNKNNINFYLWNSFNKNIWVCTGEINARRTFSYFAKGNLKQFRPSGNHFCKIYEELLRFHTLTLIKKLLFKFIYYSLFYNKETTPGKPMNTGVGSLSLLPRIFPTQESNWGLLHCRRILYQLNYQGIPHICIHTHTHTHTHIYIYIKIFN